METSKETNDKVFFYKGRKTILCKFNKKGKNMYEFKTEAQVRTGTKEWSSLLTRTTEKDIVQRIIKNYRSIT